jgi:uncharacterized glyoxalase superfamily protein PhnB
MNEKPAISGPVMRYLGVADAGRSVAFYGDVLGFEVREADGGWEAASGPARIRFGTAGYEPGDWENPRPPGSAMVFFETSDVEAMHAFIRARGGSPGGIQQVNWINVRMFGIDDPDGHRLWFGQSRNGPEPAVKQPMLERIMPSLPFDDVAAGVEHYRDVLGFTVNYAQHDIAVMDRDHVRVLLVARTGRHGGIGSAYVYVANADLLHAELSAKGARVQGEPVSQPWGLREFRVADPEGNEITFGQPFE